jgi:hypothetical protein
MMNTTRWTSLAVAAGLVICGAAAAPAHAAVGDTVDAVKEGAKEVGHSTAEIGRNVGHKAAEVGHEAVAKGKQAGHAVANTARSAKNKTKSALKSTNDKPAPIENQTGK